jgi:hypothetical protein
MSAGTTATPRTLAASAYVLPLFEASSHLAAIARNRASRQTVQAIAKTLAVTKPEFKIRLTNQNAPSSGVEVISNRTDVCSCLCRHSFRSNRRTKGARDASGMGRL